MIAPPGGRNGARPGTAGRRARCRSISRGSRPPVITALLPPPCPALARHGEARSPNWAVPCCLLRQRAAAPEAVSDNAPRQRHPGNPLPVAPGRRPSRTHTACVRARPFPVPAIPSARGSGPAVAAVAPACRAREHPAHAAAVPQSSQASPGSAYRRKCQRTCRFERRPQSAPPSGSTLPLSRASLAGNQSVWDVSTSEYPSECRLRVGFTERDSIGIGDSGRASAPGWKV